MRRIIFLLAAFMSSQSSDTNPSGKLARYEPEVREAYARFLETGDVAAVQVVILAMVREHLPKPSDAPITDEQKLVEDLGYDSLAVAEVVFAIEDVFGLRIETSEIMQISTVGSLKEFISKKLGPQNTP
jgi:acyl carrier protein